MSNYGVPQRRSRVIIVGLREDYFGDAEAILDRIYSKKAEERIIPYQEMVTVQDAIGDLPKIYPVKNPSDPMDESILIRKEKMRLLSMTLDFTMQEISKPSAFWPRICMKEPNCTIQLMRSKICTPSAQERFPMYTNITSFDQINQETQSRRICIRMD